MVSESGYNHGAAIPLDTEVDALIPYDQVVGPGVQNGVPFEIYVVAGTHRGCGLMDYGRVGEDYGFLHCRSCGIRVTFPVAVTTYEELFAHFNPDR